MNDKITITTSVHAPIAHVWEHWTLPAHIMKWNAASDDWHTPRAENDLRAGGDFSYRMEARDGSAGFDFAGTYTEVVRDMHIAYLIGDGRNVDVTFEPSGNEVKITETFELESTHSPDQQRAGWQAILDNFKKYAEGSNS